MAKSSAESFLKQSTIWRRKVAKMDQKNERSYRWGAVIACAILVIVVTPVLYNKWGNTSSNQDKSLVASSEHKGIIRLAGVTAAFYLPLMVAHDEKLFEKYGYSSELTLFNNNNDMMNALLHGDADVSALGSGGAFALEAQSPGRVRFVYGQNNRSYSLLVPTNSRISSLGGLKGKRIGTWPSPTPPVLLHLLLDKPTGSQFEIVPIEFRFMNQALKRGEVDALFNTDVFTQQAVESSAAQFLSKFPLEEYVMKPFFNGGGLVLGDLEAQRPGMSKAINGALEDAVKMINDQPSVIQRALIKNLGVSPSVASAAPVDEFILVRNVDITKAQAVADIFRKSGVLSKAIDVGHMFPKER
jgi:ABC-type nitrate/sulfonate/bicarbonate transport system substrate-binding protein